MACCKIPTTTIAPIVECCQQLFVKLNDGNKMPLVGLGTWQSTEAECRKAVRDSINAGYRLIDTAYWYDNEPVIGSELEAIFKEGVIKREDLFITTKLHPAYMGPNQVVPILKKQLADLRLDYVDLYLIHWPVSYKTIGEPADRFPVDANGKVKFDYSKHYTETWKGMEEAKRMGLAKSIGISNFNVRQVEDILLRASIRPAVLQIESHPYLANRKLIDYCQLRNIAITAYSTFANPGNSWAPRESEKYPKPMQDEGLKAIAAKYPGKTVAHVMLRWQIERGAAVIPRSITPERIKANLNIFDFNLSTEDIEAINAMDKGQRMCPFPDGGSSSSRDYPFDEYRDVADAFA